MEFLPRTRRGNPARCRADDPRQFFTVTVRVTEVEAPAELYATARSVWVPLANFRVSSLHCQGATFSMLSCVLFMKNTTRAIPVPVTWQPVESLKVPEIVAPAAGEVNVTLVGPLVVDTGCTVVVCAVVVDPKSCLKRAAELGNRVAPVGLSFAVEPVSRVS